MKLLLIQFRTDQSAPHEQRCVLTHGALDASELEVVSPLLDPEAAAKLSAADYDAIIIGGSGEFNLSDPAPELNKALAITRPLIDAALSADQPFLGMCFGHQLLSQHLGGTIGHYPDGARVGAYRIALTASGKTDPLYTNVSDEFDAQHGHKDFVATLPKGAVVLSTSDRDPHASYRYGANVYSVQYHPELSQEDILYRMELYPSYMAGKTEEEIRQIFRSTPHAPQILKNFVDGVRRGRPSQFDSLS